MQVMEENKKLKEKLESQQKALEKAKVRITDLQVASLFQRFYQQMHRNIEQNRGHSQMPNLPSFSVCGEVLMSF